MRIISQDGTVDVPYERYTVFIYKDEYLNIYHIACDCGEPSCRRIAKYSTEEKAKKAMEELRYAYMCHSLFKMGQTPPGGIDEKLTMGLSGVFQFQAEEELE